MLKKRRIGSQNSDNRTTQEMIKVIPLFNIPPCPTALFVLPLSVVGVVSSKPDNRIEVCAYIYFAQRHDATTI